MKLCAQCGEPSGFFLCSSCLALNRRKYESDRARRYYTEMFLELLYDAEALGNSRPLSKMSAAIMREQKETSLKRIDDLTGFLSLLREKIEKIETELLIHTEEEGRDV